MNQGFTQIVGPSSIDSSVVYFLRGSINESIDPSLMQVSPGYVPSANSSGFYPSITYGGGVFTNMVGFCLYDSNMYLGKLYTHEYVRYECKAGYHLFWAKGKRNEFLEAELEAGKVYFIDVSATIGEKNANLRPVHPYNKYWVNGITSFISSQSAVKLTETELQNAQKRKNKKITKVLDRLDEEKAKGRLFGKLEKDMYYRQP